MQVTTLEVQPVLPPKSFGSLTYRGELWNLDHLDSFAFLYELEPEFMVTVVVVFSCHCFTRGIADDANSRSSILDADIFDDGRERRILCPDRYAWSQQYLRDIILSLPNRRITVADEGRSNFVTVETLDDAGTPMLYAIFFEVLKVPARKRRLLLRVQSAYKRDRIFSKRRRAAGRVTLRSILLATLEGRKIRA